MIDPKVYDIIVNATPHKLTSDVVTFDEIVEIAFPGHPTGEDFVYSVTFEKAESKPHDGTLVQGGKVTVRKHGTIFDVTQTNRS
ncbi:MAG: multiubiquitin domain-containing protein [Acidobacteriota bacterium]|nr:multiubiquitin domain-containing protein [Acidobacteriota bacterium]